MRNAFFLLLTVAALLQTTDYQTLTSSMWQICKTSDGAQVLLRPPLSLQHLVTGGQTEGPGSWTAVQRPGSKKKECCSQTLLSQNYSIPELYFNSHFSTLRLCCFWPPLTSLVFWFCFSLRHIERMHLHCQALGRLKIWLGRAQLMCIHA